MCVCLCVVYLWQSFRITVFQKVDLFSNKIYLVNICIVFKSFMREARITACLILLYIKHVAILSLAWYISINSYLNMAKQDLYLENEKIGYISSTRVNKKKVVIQSDCSIQCLTWTWTNTNFVIEMFRGGPTCDLSVVHFNGILINRQPIRWEFLNLFIFAHKNWSIRLQKMIASYHVKTYQEDIV